MSKQLQREAVKDTFQLLDTMDVNARHNTRETCFHRLLNAPHLTAQMFVTFVICIQAVKCVWDINSDTQVPD